MLRHLEAVGNKKAFGSEKEGSVVPVSEEGCQSSGQFGYPFKAGRSHHSCLPGGLLFVQGPAFSRVAAGLVNLRYGLKIECPLRRNG